MSSRLEFVSLENQKIIRLTVKATGTDWENSANWRLREMQMETIQRAVFPARPPVIEKQCVDPLTQ